MIETPSHPDTWSGPSDPFEQARQLAHDLSATANTNEPSSETTSHQPATPDNTVGQPPDPTPTADTPTPPQLRPPRNRRVGPDNPDFIAAQEAIRQDRDNNIYASETIFGQANLHYIDRERVRRADFLNRHPLATSEDIADYQEAIDKVVEQLRDSLQTIVSSRSFSDRAGFLADLPADVPPPETHADNNTDLVALVGQLTSDQLESLLRNHRRRLETALANMTAELPRIQQSFLTRLDSAIQAGTIPITQDQVNHRLRNTQVKFYDPWRMIANRPNTPLPAADYDFSFDEIRLMNPFRSPKDIQEDYDHEMLHALAGATRKLPGTFDSRQADLSIKRGLNIGPTIKATPESRHYAHPRRSREDGQDLIRPKRFVWLNEAITEELAIAIRTDKDGAYGDQRVISYALQVLGISRQLLYEAYLEDFEEGVGTPKWGELQRELNDKISPRILLRLDQIMAQSTPQEERREQVLTVLLASIKSTTTT